MLLVALAPPPTKKQLCRIYLFFSKYNKYISPENAHYYYANYSEPRKVKYY